MSRRLTFALFLSLAVVFLAAAFRMSILEALGVRSATAQPPVPAVPADQVLEWIAAGKQVIFVDARESQEFEEEHIPGAINLSLRELESIDPERFRDADLIIAYCMKDFRGFEVAKAMRRAGFPQAAILREYGIAGWKKRGLPTVLGGKADEDGARALLNACAREPSRCGEKGG